MNVAPQIFDPPRVPSFEIDLPVPPGINRLRRIDWKSAPRMAAWLAIADNMVLASRCLSRKEPRYVPAERFAIEIVMSEDHTRTDLDAQVKSLIDYLKRIRAIVDDAKPNLRKLTVEWGTAPEGCKVRVIPVD
jgi:hypothetical protein